MLSWLRRWLRRPPRWTRRPGLEALEDRVTPSVLFSPQDGAEVASDHGGGKLSGAAVYLIFWGSGWSSPSPAPSLIQTATATLLSGPYLEGLAQYGVGSGWLDPNPIFPGLTIDPPNPFSEAQLRQLLADLIDWPASAGSLPDPAGDLTDLPSDPLMLPVVFTPRDVMSTVADANAASAKAACFTAHLLVLEGHVYTPQ